MTSQLRAIENAFDRLNTVLDASGALEAGTTKSAVQELRLAIVRGLNDPERVQVAEAEWLREIIGDLLDYAERFADQNNEPPHGHCRDLLSRATAWVESGSATVDPTEVKNDLIEYVERFADANGEPKNGDCRRLLKRARR